MPYVSAAQRRLFHSRSSPVSPEVVAEYDAASKGRKLPERVKYADGGTVDWSTKDPLDVGVTTRPPKRAMRPGERLEWKREPRPRANPIPVAAQVQQGPPEQVATREPAPIRTGSIGLRGMARGGVVPSKESAMAQGRRVDGVKGATGKDKPREFLEERKLQDKFQGRYNNERQGHVTGIRNMATGGTVPKPKTALSFAAKLVQKQRMKPSISFTRRTMKPSP